MKTALAGFCLLVVSAATAAVSAQNGGYEIRWQKAELAVTGSSHIVQRDDGNPLQWQYEAGMEARRRLVEGFIKAMGTLRVDAHRTARDILLAEPARNEDVFSYLADHRGREALYDERTVSVRASFPMFGSNGFAPLLIDAGLDQGAFPDYEGHVFSVAFTGLVVDARGLGRKPAIAPRLFDEDHNVVYSIDFVEPERFAEWGAVEYTEDPFYRGREERVGKNPLRVVALRSDRLIETDIAISNIDARTLIQNGGTRASLAEGRVIVIIELPTFSADSK